MSLCGKMVAGLYGKLESEKQRAHSQISALFFGTY